MFSTHISNIKHFSYLTQKHPNKKLSVTKKSTIPNAQTHAGKAVFGTNAHNQEKKCSQGYINGFKKFFFRALGLYRMGNKGVPFSQRSVAKAVLRRNVRYRSRSAFIPLFIRN